MLLLTGLGTIVTLMFENRATMLNQIHEMLRAEKVVNDDLVYEELKAYNPLIPQGREWVATVMFEIEDPVRRAAVLARLGGVEVVLELLLEHAVDAADLLLLAKLEAVVAHLAAPDAVLTRRGRPALERALLGIAAGALQEELPTLAPAEPADGFGIAGHRIRSSLRPGAAWAGGSRCAGWA
mgnify:CR=1 FL=1